MSRSLLSFAIVAALTIPGQARQAAPAAPQPSKPTSQLDSLKTVAESSEYRSTSTYAEVLGFMKIVDDASPNIRVISYGTTPRCRCVTSWRDRAPSARYAPRPTR